MSTRTLYAVAVSISCLALLPQVTRASAADTTLLSTTPEVTLAQYYREGYRSDDDYYYRRREYRPRNYQRGYDYDAQDYGNHQYQYYRRY